MEKKTLTLLRPKSAGKQYHSSQQKPEGACYLLQNKSCHQLGRPSSDGVLISKASGHSGLI